MGRGRGKGGKAKGGGTGGGRGRGGSQGRGGRGGKKAATGGQTTRKCCWCLRPLRECNAQPCPAKRDSTEEEVTGQLASLHLANVHGQETQARKGQDPFEIENRRRIQDLVSRGLLLGKVQTAIVCGHSNEGFIVDVIVEDREAPAATLSNSEETDDSEAEIKIPHPPTNVTFKGLVKWHKPTIERWPSVDSRVRAAKKRVPVGSKFGVYSAGICDYTGDLRLRPATKASPVLNTAALSFNSSYKKQPFRYLVIIDLEATCDYCLEPLVDASTNSEIIEFPWVVMDTQTLEVIHEERYFVKPVFLDGVTRYCSALTGITQDMVAHSMDLQGVLSKFEDYVTQRFDDTPLGFECQSFRIITDGPWDIQIQLSIEAQRKGIDLPWWFKEYFDLKVEFDKFFPYFVTSKHGQSLHIMLQALGLPFVGRHHSGLDDCKTIAQIIGHLIKLGHSFKKPTRIETDFDPLKEEWNKFDNVPSGAAWLCPGCALWNRPFARHRCVFCQMAKPSP